jgi:hypothetical protein
MRISTYLMTVDPLDAGGMLELETIRKALKIAGNVFGLHVRGRGPRKEAAIKDGKGSRGYDMVKIIHRIYLLDMQQDTMFI